MIEINIAIRSAKVLDSQIPVSPKKAGRIRTEPTWNTRVRRKEITADTSPLFNAVKNADAKMLIPHTRNDRAKMWNADLVNCYRSGS